MEEIVNIIVRMQYVVTDTLATFYADLEKIKAYIDSFRYGAPPHAGGGIGKENKYTLVGRRGEREKKRERERERERRRRRGRGRVREREEE